MGNYDRSSKWLIEHHGDSILRLAGVTDVVSWRPLPAELVQPGQLPDGVIEAHFAGREEPVLFVLELATDPERRVQEQVARDALLVFLARRVLPEVLTILLHPKGQYTPGEEVVIESQLRWTSLALTWHNVELWRLSAEELLATDDPGVAPWIPLTAFEGPPESLLLRCRELIERRAPAGERADLLVVTQFLAKLRYNEGQLIQLLGGRQSMIESPLLQEIVAEAKHESLLRVLRVRFGTVPPDLATLIHAEQDAKRLDDIIEVAACSSDLEAVRRSLTTH